MTDLTKVDMIIDGTKVNNTLIASAKADTSYFLSGGFYDSCGNPITAEFMNALSANCINPSATVNQHAGFGICVKHSNVRAFPTDLIITDEIGDNNFDYIQISGVRVNEPVIVKSISTDGQYYYVNTSCCDGWVKASDVALCKDRQEWLSAFQIPDEKRLVVTTGKFYLEQSNTRPETSGLMLTMGTTLQLAAASESSGLITNRSAYQNYAVYIPVRANDGSYEKKLALISENKDVSVGYLPLTEANILDVAFSMLGDTYGWGSMLSSADCSGYIRDIYKCFGYDLPRNTSWQAAMQVFGADLTGLEDAPKKQLLSTMSAGTILYFKGHEMMYLGSSEGEYYCISSVSSIMNPDGSGKQRTRSVMITPLTVKRANGKTWLTELNHLNIPYFSA